MSKSSQSLSQLRFLDYTEVKDTENIGCARNVLHFLWAESH